MDRRIKNLILEVDGWIKQPITTLWEAGDDICGLIRSTISKLEEGEIGYWGNTSVSKGLIESIYDLSSKISESSYNVFSAQLSYTTHDDLEALEFYEAYAVEEKHLLMHWINELQSITQGLRNSNSF